MIPNLTICIALKMGVEKMADRAGLQICAPFCDMSRDESSMTYDEISCVPAMSLHSLVIISFILVVWIELWL